MGIFVEVTENECLINKHVRDIDTLQFTVRPELTTSKCVLHHMIERC